MPRQGLPFRPAHREAFMSVAPISLWTAVMRRALALAELGRGGAAPNPMVGAVLLKNGQVVAEGFHRRAGSGHAEVECLRGIPAHLSRGADLVVSLEPCCHHGRTGPCTELILERGIARVVVATVDPNPLVAGQGLAALRRGGVETHSGLLAREARELNRNFFRRMERGRPWITLKWAQSVDGRIAAMAGARTLLSGAQSRLETLRLRAAHPGLLVGIGTALADDPRLGLDLPKGQIQGRAPHRLVLDSRARLPLESRLVRSAGEQALTVLCGSHAPASRVRALQACGVGVAVHASSHPPLDWVMAQALALGLDGLLVEGGAKVHGAFLEAGLADEIHIVTAPLLLGRGVPCVEMPGGTLLSEWRLGLSRRLGADSWHVWRPKGDC